MTEQEQAVVMAIEAEIKNLDAEFEFTLQKRKQRLFWGLQRENNKRRLIGLPGGVFPSGFPFDVSL